MPDLDDAHSTARAVEHDAKDECGQQQAGSAQGQQASASAPPADASTGASTHAGADTGVGIVTPRDYVCTMPFTFKSGQVLPSFTLRYETYGQLNTTRDNAILICHALSGDHHCAGRHSASDRKPGWWDHLIGPGRAVDTDRFYVICANCLGGCSGTTGPSSINPATGRSYGISFPFVTINDMVRSQKRLLDHLGVEQLHAVIGGSMGGMQALLWAILYPSFVRRVLAMATTSREGAQAIAFNEVGRQAIMQDPAWEQGNYPADGGPRVGLAIARMMAHITYLSDASMERKFGRRKRPRSTSPPGADGASKAAQAAGTSSASASNADQSPYSFDIQFEVESYLRYQGQSFINRFDANSYLYITRALDHFDLAHAYGSLEAAFAPVQAETLVVGFTSDWLFPPEQNREIALTLLRAGKRASYAELATDRGHDSFLLESPDLYRIVRGFLEREQEFVLDFVI